MMSCTIFYHKHSTGHSQPMATASFFSGYSGGLSHLLLERAAFRPLGVVLDSGAKLRHWWPRLRRRDLDAPDLEEPALEQFGRELENEDENGGSPIEF